MVFDDSDSAFQLPKAESQIQVELIQLGDFPENQPICENRTLEMARQAHNKESKLTPTTYAILASEA